MLKVGLDSFTIRELELSPFGQIGLRQEPWL